MMTISKRLTSGDGHKKELPFIKTQINIQIFYSPWIRSFGLEPRVMCFSLSALFDNVCVRLNG